MITLVSPDGHRLRLRWTSQHSLSSYGRGVLLRARSDILLDSKTFAVLARQGWRIECSTQQERYRIMNALSWALYKLPNEALVMCKNKEKVQRSDPSGF